MISCAKKYRKIVRKNLRCVGNTRKEILKRFDNSLSAFLEDNPNATEEDLFVAFGPALEMSDVLMESVPQAEIENYHKQKKTKKNNKDFDCNCMYYSHYMAFPLDAKTNCDSRRSLTNCMSKQH